MRQKSSSLFASARLFASPALLTRIETSPDGRARLLERTLDLLLVRHVGHHRDRASGQRRCGGLELARGAAEQRDARAGRGERARDRGADAAAAAGDECVAS